MKNTAKSSVLVPLAVLALAAGTAHAQAPGGKGFTPPGTNFGANPFAGKTPPMGGGDLFEGATDEDFDPDEDVSDISDEILRQRMEQRLKSRAGNQPTGGPPPAYGAPPSAPGRPGVDFGGAAND